MNFKEKVLILANGSKALYYRLKNPGARFYMLSFMALGKLPLLFLEMRDPAAWHATVFIYGSVLNTLCLYTTYLVYKSSLEMYIDPPRRLTFFEVLIASKNRLFGFFFELKELVCSPFTPLLARRPSEEIRVNSTNLVVLPSTGVLQAAILRDAYSPAATDRSVRMLEGGILLSDDLPRASMRMSS